MGKTRLADELAQGSDALVLSGRAGQGATAPYGPVVAALRSYLRSRPDGLDDCGPLRAHLALILPELGEPAPASDRATLFEAVRAAIAHLARERLVLLVLDDLQWSDDATLELLAALAEPLARDVGAGGRRLPLRRPAARSRAAPACAASCAAAGAWTS